MRALAMTLVGLLGLCSYAAAAPKNPKPFTAKMAQAKVASYLGAIKGGWTIELSRKMGKVKVGGLTKTATKYFEWHAVSNKKSYAPWDGTEGTPGYLYKVFDGRVNTKGKVVRYPTFSEWMQGPDSF